MQFAPQVTTAGTYTYTLTCSSGPISVQQSATVTFENNAPFVATSLSAARVTFSGSPADYTTYSWISNLSNCSGGGSIGASELALLAASWLLRRVRRARVRQDA